MRLEEKEQAAIITAIKELDPNAEIYLFGSRTDPTKKGGDIDTLELVNEGTMVDRINRAEKREIVSSAKNFTELRLLRNTIVHEYEPDEYTGIFQDVLNFTPSLLEAVENAKQYSQKFFQ